MDLTALPDENTRVVEQLDEVNKESEEKAEEIINFLDTLSEELGNASEFITSLIEETEDDIKLFNSLNTKFPDIDIFSKKIKKKEKHLEDLKSLFGKLEEQIDQTFEVMNNMQYQDIHRQKIERVVNFIRTLAGYLNTLFSSERDDSERAPSAQHIPGDNGDTMAEDEIEALLSSFGNKK
ncbi:MAG: hypothetical protein GQ570_06915 [Helicobacteraceae bacterium]|nr:hypothetical protein [Helicobacteraceae bacterium]